MKFLRFSIAIRKWWPALALAGLVPLIVANLALTHMLTDMQTQTMQDGLRQQGAAAMAESPSLDRGDIPQFRILSKRMAHQNPDWYGLMLTDRRRELVDTETLDGQPLPPVLDFQSLSWTWATAMPVVGDFVDGSVPVRQPVMRDGAVRYTVTITF